MPDGVYEERGICLRHHCGAEPPRDLEPPGLVPTSGWRDRASASYAAADRVKAPARAARGRFRGIHGGRRRGVSEDRKSTRLNSSHGYISYAVFCLKKKK